MDCKLYCLKNVRKMMLKTLSKTFEFCTSIFMSFGLGTIKEIILSYKIA